MQIGNAYSFLTPYTLTIILSTVTAKTTTSLYSGVLSVTRTGWMRYTARLRQNYTYVQNRSVLRILLTPVLSTPRSTVQGNDWVDSNGTDGKSTFHRRANQSWLSKICNHFADITAWSRKPLTMFTQKLPFFGKKTPYGQIFENVSQKDSPPLRSTCCL